MKGHAILVFVALCLLTFLHVSGICPNSCSGHGSCGRGNICTCDSGWTHAADCSLKSCPTGYSFADKASAENVAHAVAECSNQGSCDRRYGTCRCAAGFEGQSCDKITCGFENCNNLGSCVPIHYLYDMYTGDSSVGLYNSWDAKKMYACVCDMGNTGNDCFMRMCPKGDDPLTPFVDYRTILISTSTSSGSLTGVLKFFFNGEYFRFPAAWTASQCEAAFEELPNIETVTCTVSANANGQTNNNDITVMIREFPMYPHENNIYSHDGDPKLNAFGCDTTEAIGADVACTITDVDGVDYPEYSYCSNRGICNFRTGSCDCFPSFSGANCGEFSPQLLGDGSAEASSDILALKSSRSSFTNNVLRLANTNAGTSAFKYLELLDFTGTIFEIDGYGNIVMHYGGLTVSQGGATVTLSGLKVDAGGITIQDDGFTMTGGLTIYKDGLKVNAGGMFITGALTIMTGGIRVSQGLTMSSGSLTVTTGGLLQIAGGASILGGGLKITGGLSVLAGGMVQTGGLTIATNGMSVTGGISVSDGGVTVTGGTTVSDHGLRITGGMTVHDFGIFSHTGGLSVVGDGVTTTGGLSVSSGGMKVTGGVSVESEGIFVQRGVTVDSSGLRATSGELSLTGGLTVYDMGLTIPAGLTLHSGGISIPLGGVLIRGSSGIVVTDGISIMGNGTFSILSSIVSSSFSSLGCIPDYYVLVCLFLYAWYVLYSLYMRV